MNEQIRSILSAHGGLPVEVASLRDDDDLYAAGLRSFASVQIMLALEETFAVEFPERLLDRSTFSSISTIEAAVRECAPPTS